jgi:hypothetical protein
MAASVYSNTQRFYAAGQSFERSILVYRDNADPPRVARQLRYIADGITLTIVSLVAASSESMFGFGIVSSLYNE